MQENRPIIALDFSSKEEVQLFLARFPKEETLFVKVGMELFYQEGPEIVRYIKSLGHLVFLDLKLHDIPNTVKSAMKGIARLGVDMTNVHAAGGVQMMKEAQKGLQEGATSGKPPLLIAVTQLTSTSEEAMHKDQLIQTSLIDSVKHYAKKAKEAGLQGVVCSAKEVEVIQQELGKDFLCITPGIRPNGESIGDQKRVMTPKKAREIGANYIVVGRPITQSQTPVQAYQNIKKEWENG